MARHKRHNPEKREFRGRSYRNGGKLIVELRAKNDAESHEVELRYATTCDVSPIRD